MLQTLSQKHDMIRFSAKSRDTMVMQVNRQVAVVSRAKQSLFSVFSLLFTLRQYVEGSMLTPSGCT